MLATPDSVRLEKPLAIIECSFILRMKRFFVDHAGLKDDRCSTHAALAACVQAKKEKDAATKPASKPAAPKKEEEKKPEKKPEEEAPEESGQSFQVGDKVVCKLTKKSQANYLFDGESGTVEKVLKDKCRVYFPALKAGMGLKNEFEMKCVICLFFSPSKNDE